MSLADDTKAFLSTCGVCGIWESEEIGVCEWFFCCLVCDKVFVIVFVDIAIIPVEGKRFYKYFHVCTVSIHDWLVKQIRKLDH